MKFISDDEVENLHLPDPVKRYLTYTHVIGKEKIQTARLKQRGFFRPTEDKKWMPFKAEEKYDIDDLSFSWYAKLKMAPLLRVHVIDEFIHGKGRVLVKAFNVIKIADEDGQKIDQGELLRFLSEIVWFPTFFVDKRLEWTPIDGYSAQVRLRHKNIIAAGTFFFNDEGEITKFCAERYMTLYKKKHVLKNWSVTMEEYKEINGVLIPTKGSVSWDVKTGTFCYTTVEVDTCEYNKT
ncbi:MAG: DUF6544 family protein [bacterium]